MIRNPKIVEFRRSSANRELILQAAERLFSQYGYGKTTVVDVAKHLGMSPANVYRFFQSKDEIRRTLFKRLLEANFRMAHDISRRRETACSRISRFVRLQFLLTADIVNNHQTMRDLVILGLQRDDDLLAAHIGRLRDILAKVVAEGIVHGEFAERDAQETARIFIIALVAIWHPILLKNRRVSYGVCPDDLIEFALDALRHGRPPANRMAN